VCAEAKVSIDYRGRPLSEHVPLLRWDFNKYALTFNMRALFCYCFYGADRYLHRLRMKHGLSWRQVRHKRASEFQHSDLIIFCMFDALFLATGVLAAVVTGYMPSP
jgi:hypothetical protein